MLYPTQQPFHLLDVGGGNGMYADKILNHYPNAQVTLIEPEASLIAKPYQPKQTSGLPPFPRCCAWKQFWYHPVQLGLASLCYRHLSVHQASTARGSSLCLPAFNPRRADCHVWKLLRRAFSEQFTQFTDLSIYLIQATSTAHSTTRCEHCGRWCLLP